VSKCPLHPPPLNRLRPRVLSSTLKRYNQINVESRIDVFVPRTRCPHNRYNRINIDNPDQRLPPRGRHSRRRYRQMNKTKGAFQTHAPLHAPLLWCSLSRRLPLSHTLIRCQRRLLLLRVRHALTLKLTHSLSLSHAVYINTYEILIHVGV
jgi:hypothetical protein